jgi:uncharacterized protein YdaU (DUF1376 family)
MSKAWMPMYWGDYLADTSHFTNAEHGSYLLLIAYYWCNGGLPENEDHIRKIAKCDKRSWAKLRCILMSKFSSTWKHKRLDMELLQAIEISRSARARAMRRWHCQPQPQPQPQSKKRKESIDTAARKHVLPADWVPNVADVEFAKSKGMSEQEINDEAQRFLDYVTANNRKYADDHAAWRNWVTSPYRQRKGNGNGRHETIIQRGRRLYEQALDIEAGKASGREDWLGGGHEAGDDDSGNISQRR